MVEFGRFETSLDQALDPLVMALDVGSTATRGAIYDAHGRPIRPRAKVPHVFTTDLAGTCTIDADQVVDELIEVIGNLVTDRITGRIGGVAIDTFASSLVGVDADGNACTPCFTYADARPGPFVTRLRQECDEAAIQQRTGTRFHSSYLPARFRWLEAEQPGVAARVARWMSLGEYFHLKVIGTTAAGMSTAAWTGLLDRRTGEWDADMLAVCGIRADQLSPINPPDQTLTAARVCFANRWTPLAGVRWFPVIADGFSANLGSGAHTPDTAVISLATSGAIRVLVPDPIGGAGVELPSGLWSYRVDRGRSLVGGAINDVGRAMTWLRSILQLPWEQRIQEVLSADPGDTPLVLPFLTGERSTGWQAGARAALTEVRIATTAEDLLRGVMEGVALSYVRVADQLARVAGRPSRILASGRVTQEIPGFLPLMADALGTPMSPVTIKRSTLHGTALHALEMLAPGVAAVEPDRGTTSFPRPANTAVLRDRLARFEHLYDALYAPEPS